VLRTAAGAEAAATGGPRGRGAAAAVAAVLLPHTQGGTIPCCCHVVAKRPCSLVVHPRKHASMQVACVWAACLQKHPPASAKQRAQHQSKPFQYLAASVQEPAEGCLTTMEAAARALGILERDASLVDTLLAPLVLATALQVSNEHCIMQ